MEEKKIKIKIKERDTRIVRFLSLLVIVLTPTEERGRRMVRLRVLRRSGHTGFSSRDSVG